MVVFSCQNCGDSVRKNFVDKHKIKCRRPLVMTCVDCFKDFRNDEYIGHTSCITESERYGGLNYKPKPIAVKQTEWVEVCHGMLEKNNFNSQERRLLEIMSSFTNVPRNENKFVNFVKNISKSTSFDVATRVYHMISDAYKAKKTEMASKNVSAQLATNEDDKKQCSGREKEANEMKTDEVDEIKQKKKKKKKHSDNDVESHEGLSRKELKKLRQKGLKNKEDLDEEEENVEDQEKKADDQVVNNLNKKELKRLKRVSGLEGVKHEIGEEGENVEDRAKNSVKIEDVVNEETLEKLSRKEKKRLQKQKKYEAEVRAITKEIGEDVENGVVEGQNEVDTQKESKKRKGKRRAEETAIPPEVVVLEQNGDSGGAAKKIKVNDVASSDQPTGKFDWERVILALLTASSDHEMSLKRLSKKVVAEYQFQKGAREEYEKVAAKFNKKVNKTPGVRVIKDKAKLISS